MEDTTGEGAHFLCHVSFGGFLQILRYSDIREKHDKKRFKDKR